MRETCFSKRHHHWSKLPLKTWWEKERNDSFVNCICNKNHYWIRIEFSRNLSWETSKLWLLSSALFSLLLLFLSFFFSSSFSLSLSSSSSSLLILCFRFRITKESWDEGGNGWERDEDGKTEKQRLRGDGLKNKKERDGSEKRGESFWRIEKWRTRKVSTAATSCWIQCSLVPSILSILFSG